MQKVAKVAKMGNGYLINCDFFNVEKLFKIAPFNNSKSIRAVMNIDYILFFMLLKQLVKLTFAFSRSSNFAFLRQADITVSFSDEQFNSLMTCKVISLGSLLNAMGDKAVPLIKIAR